MRLRAEDKHADISFHYYRSFSHCICNRRQARIIRGRQFEFPLNIFFRVILHHLIERELLIKKIYFLNLANASFGRKI
jgi:hypothetical protein